MGLFSKKKTTTTKVVTEKATATKVVKLTYIQSILINGGAAKEEQYAGVSSATEVTLDSSKKTNQKEFDKIVDQLRNPLTTAFSAGLPYLAGVTSSLFGKKTTTEVNVNAKESGWSIVKSWAQPEFDIIRYALGIKEISASHFVYDRVSELISKPWSSPKEISKISLLADQFIPAQFPPGVYIEYYVKPDFEDSNWLRITPMELPSQYNSDGTIIPRIISFNSERPISAREEESYVVTPKPVKAVRFRAILKRPQDSLDSYTPVLRSYRLMLTPLGGL